MKINLKDFQNEAVRDLRDNAQMAMGMYGRYRKQQVIAFTAPTGAGKTIMMTAFIEDILYGCETMPERPDSIFVWLSDSPQLNEQSKDKILSKSDKITSVQCETITPDSFKGEVLEDGKIYFLNTQLMANGNRLVSHSDGRQWTIWQALEKTVEDKGDRLYFIIDEAHRGTRDTTAARQTAIMQRFLRGWAHEDGTMPPMPVVIGMSATIRRFRALVEGLSSVTMHTVDVPITRVKDSGLLKERICAHYDDSGARMDNNISVLSYAALAWKSKCEHWDQYCREMHYAYVNPALIVQVENGNDAEVSKTDLNLCVRKIEEIVGRRFEIGEVVHAFGSPKDAVLMNGLRVEYMEPSKIAADEHAKVIFFKEGLTTGWDCPRAEVIMSFRKADDDTNIAQLLGRMIRMPRQQHVTGDASLNEVDIFLPNFNQAAVREVVDKLRDDEGAELPTEIDEMPISATDSRVLVLEPPRVAVASTQQAPIPISTTSAPIANEGKAPEEFHLDAGSVSISAANAQGGVSAPAPEGNTIVATGNDTLARGDAQPVEAPVSLPSVPLWVSEFDRKAVRDFINAANIRTFRVRAVRTSSYLKSLFDISSLLMRSNVCPSACDDVKGDIAALMHDYILELKQNARYDALADKVRKFQLKVEIFDPFGYHASRQAQDDLLSATETDIDNQYRIAESRLFRCGVGYEYGRRYLDDADPQGWKVDVIICVAEQEFNERLEKLAERRYFEYQENYRVQLTRGPKAFCDEYRGIVYSASTISALPYILPDRPFDGSSGRGAKYARHLFVTERDGSIRFELNGWEQKTLEAETVRGDFVCWLRNPQKANQWALGYAYGPESAKKAGFPDFLIVRRDPANENGYLLDVLEPHGDHLEDNLEKARGLARFAIENPMLSRVEMIRVTEDAAGHAVIMRLNLADPSKRLRLNDVNSGSELSNLFE